MLQVYKSRAVGLLWYCLKLMAQFHMPIANVGKVGTCSHMFAVMKLVGKWAIDKLTKIPEIKACT